MFFSFCIFSTCQWGKGGGSCSLPRPPPPPPPPPDGYAAGQIAEGYLIRQKSLELYVLNRNDGLIVPSVKKSFWSKKPSLVHNILQWILFILSQTVSEITFF